MIGAIVQARTGSTRLPGKVMLPLAGKPALWHVLSRLQHAKKIEQIVLATTDLPEDKILRSVADELSIPIFFGSADDVLARYYFAAKQFHFKSIVRITADCPVIDPTIVDEMIGRFLQGGYDFYSLKGAPDGLDVGIYSFYVLRAAYEECVLPSEREHVGGLFFEKNKSKFKLGAYEKFKDQESERWTLDEPKDYEFLKMIFNELYREGRIFLASDIMRLLEEKPELKKINQGIIRNEGFLKSLKKDDDFLKSLKRPR